MITTMAIGEEGSGAKFPDIREREFERLPPSLGGMTTQAVGEEEGDIQFDTDLSTLEKIRPAPGVAVTRALGEMADGSINPAFEGVFSAAPTPLTPVTMALGESADGSINTLPGGTGDATPIALPDGGSINPVTMAIPENAGDPQPPLAEVTTAALGEEGNPPLPPELDRPPVSVTQALGEQPGDVMPVTMAIPENGGDPGPMTMAIPENAGDPLPPGLRPVETPLTRAVPENGGDPGPMTQAIPENGGDPLPPSTMYPQPNYPTRPGPMNPGGLASLVQLPMFQEFAQQLHESHPEQSAMFSQMFMGGMQQPMMRPPMFGMGFGGGFSPYMGMMGMGRPMMPPPMMYGGMPMGMGYGGGFGGYGGGYGGFGMGSPFMGGGYGYGMGLGSYYQPPMQQAPAPQPSTYSPAQPQQTNANYQPPQSPSPFGGALRGYYA